jgi:hypothetical protein
MSDKKDDLEVDAAVAEEESFLAYVEGVKDDGPDEEFQKGYWKQRLDEVKRDFKVLLMNREEMDARKDEAGIANVQKALRENFKARKVSVTKLRSLGVPVTDRVIPLSAI